VTLTNRQRSPHTVFLRTDFIATLLFIVSAWFCPKPVQGQNALLAPESSIVKTPATVGRDANCRIIYLGFVGALEPAHNKNSGVVQIRDTLLGQDFPDVCASAYSPYVWTEGRDWLLTHFPSHTGVLTLDELQHSPKVILVGHSMGGWAMMSVARELRSRDIPVELTIQVDSVGITDYTLPRNVKNGAIFHARDVLMFLTTKHLRCQDPCNTNLLANITVKSAGHESITRDPRIRELVMKTVENLRTELAAQVVPVTPAPE
jgi:hypothetical protein